MLSSLSQNMVLVGIVGGMLTGSLLWLLKAVPRLLLDLLVRAVTVTVTISSDDEVFEWLNDWLARHPYTARARRLKVSSRSVQSDWVLAPGLGRHLLWERGVPILVEREMNDKAGEAHYGRPQERFILTTLGRSQERLRATIDQANQLRQRRDKLEVRVWQSGWWKPLARKAKRPLESLFLAPGMLDEMVADARWFFSPEAAAYHAQLGIPHRLGWLFKGGPGTGKTTAAMALASHFDRPIYILNLGTVGDDNQLIESFTSADPHCILLVEDGDTVAITHERAGTGPALQVPPPSQPGEEKKEGPKGITLSGVLNAIDGVASADGRLFIMTTNRPEVLDSALTRSNRIDRQWGFAALTPSRVRDMVERFFPGRIDISSQMSRLAAERPAMTASDWQSLLVRSRRDPSRLLELAHATHEIAA